jgi:hypothetical protein
MKQKYYLLLISLREKGNSILKICLIDGRYNKLRMRSRLTLIAQSGQLSDLQRVLGEKKNVHFIFLNELHSPGFEQHNFESIPEVSDHWSVAGSMNADDISYEGCTRLFL